MRQDWGTMDGAAFVRYALDEIGVTQQELAGLMGVSPENVSHILNRRHRLTPQLRLIVAQVVAQALALVVPVPPCTGEQGRGVAYLQHMATCPTCLRGALDNARAV